MRDIKIALIDNNDSFTYIIAEYLRRIEACRLEVIPCLTGRIQDLLPFDKLVISPGPGQPGDFPFLFELLEKFHADKPVLGICLGHQAIAAYFGAALINIKPVAHGQPQRIRVLKRSPLYRDLPDSFTVGLYHSWVVDRSTLPSSLEISAEAENGRVMSLSVRDYPLYGVQFHPESYVTEHGYRILENFVRYGGEE